MTITMIIWVVDSDYQGTIKLLLHNGDKDIKESLRAPLGITKGLWTDYLRPSTIYMLNSDLQCDDIWG